MTTITVSREAWRQCFQSFVESEFVGTKIRSELYRVYTITGWSLSDDFQNMSVQFNDDRYIPEFLLRWS